MMSEEAIEQAVGGIKEKNIVNANKGIQELVEAEKDDRMEAAEQVVRGNEKSEDSSPSAREDVGKAMEMVGNTQRVVQANPKGLQAHIEGDPTDDFDLASSFCPLANTPIYKLVSITDEQKDMTVEQWIRYEIQLQLEQFRADGMRKLAVFTERAEEVRRTIEVLPEIINH
jgi:hypothetical protein